MGGTAPGLGTRVVVTGLPGSGKSTLAIALAAQTGLPLIHLDLHFWQPGWTAPTEEAWRTIQRDVLAGDGWIADGNYHETLDLRLERATAVVVFGTPWWRCSARALLRGLRLPDQLPPGCDYPRWMRLRDEWRLAGRIVRIHRTEPALERAIIAEHAAHLAVHVLTSKAEVSTFLESVP